MPEDEIRELWVAFTSGEEEAFANLFSSFYPQFYRYGLKIIGNEEMVKDVIQHTFLYLYENRRQLAHDVDNVRSYLFTSFRRNLLRKRQQGLDHHLHEGEASIADQAFIFDPEDILIRKETGEQNRDLLLSILNDLPPRQREILYLKYYQNQTIGEIADHLAITYQTVANHLYRALQHLRDNDRLSGLFNTAMVLIYNQLS